VTKFRAMLGLAKAAPKPAKPVAMDYSTWARTHQIRAPQDSTQVTNDVRPLVSPRRLEYLGSVGDRQHDAVQDVVLTDGQLIDAGPSAQLPRQFLDDDRASADHVGPALVHRR
jgi:hypothetical protein